MEVRQLPMVDFLSLPKLAPLAPSLQSAPAPSTPNVPLQSRRGLANVKQDDGIDAVGT